MDNENELTVDKGILKNAFSPAESISEETYLDYAECEKRLLMSEEYFNKIGNAVDDAKESVRKFTEAMHKMRPDALIIGTSFHEALQKITKEAENRKQLFEEVEKHFKILTVPVINEEDSIAENFRVRSDYSLTVRREGRKIGRNEKCVCGSGKKYKNCCIGVKA